MHLQHRSAVGEHDRLAVAEPQLRVARAVRAEQQVLLLVVGVEDAVADGAVEGGVVLHQHDVEDLHHRPQPLRRALVSAAGGRGGKTAVRPGAIAGRCQRRDWDVHGEIATWVV